MTKVGITKDPEWMARIGIGTGRFYDPRDIAVRRKDAKEATRDNGAGAFHVRYGARTGGRWWRS